jgi:hypothetical protein
MKYSPVFGRYGFASKGSEGTVLRVGDRVVLSKKNEERTRFCKSSFGGTTSEILTDSRLARNFYMIRQFLNVQVDEY